MREPMASPASGPDGPAYRLHSVDHALQLLLLFRSKPSLRVSEVADHLNVARSTAHRLLGMLVHRQFAVQDPATKAYRPGPRLVEIGLAAVGALDVRARMRPYLAEIAAATGETVSLLVLDADSVHFIDSIESQRTVRVGSRLDARMPAHSTSAGKAMLAALTTDEVLAIYPAERLVTATEGTLSSRTQLLGELERGRRFRHQLRGERSWPGGRRHGRARPGRTAGRRLYRCWPDAAHDPGLRAGDRPRPAGGCRGRLRGPAGRPVPLSRTGPRPALLSDPSFSPNEQWSKHYLPPRRVPQCRIAT